MDKSMKRQRITLEIDFNPDLVDPPQTWDWAKELGIREERVRVIEATPIKDVK